MAAALWPEHKQQKLSAYRYCFTRRVATDPLAVYEHLLLHYHRKKAVMLGWFSYSYFPTHQLQELPRGFQVESEVIRLDETERVRELIDGVRKLHGREGDGLQKALRDASRVQRYMWALYKGLKIEVPDEYRDACTALLSNPGFEMSEPGEVRMEMFLGDFVPEEAETEAGAFTLASSKAREKLAQFQLANPRDFLVHLVAAGVAGGAPEVRVYVDSDDIVVEFEGTPLGSEVLENLFSNMLGGRASPQERELGVALNAAASLSPKILKVESWLGERGFVLDMEDGAEEVAALEASPFSSGETGHRIHFRDAPSLKVARRFVKGLEQEHPEYGVVRERCAYAPVPIKLNREFDCRSFPLDEAVCYLKLEHPEHPLPELDFGDAFGEMRASTVEASLLLLLGPEPGTHWQLNGVLYPPPAESKSWGMWVLVVDNNAGRDLSFSALNRDKEMDQLAESVGKICSDFAGVVARRFRGLSGEERPGWLPAMHRLAECGGGEVKGLPIFKVVAGELADRVQILNRWTIPYAVRDFDYPLLSGETAYVLPEPLQTLFEKERLKNVTRELEESTIYHTRRARWLETVPETDFASRAEGRFSLSFKKGEGSVSLLADPDLANQVEFYLQGRLLATESKEVLPTGIRVCLAHPEFDKDWSWSKIEENDAYLSAVRGARAEVERFFEALMGEGPEYAEFLLNYLLFLKDDGRDWERYNSKVRFKTLAGGEITLAGLAREIPWGDIMPKMTDFDDSLGASVRRRVDIMKRAVSKATIPWPLLYKVGKLMKGWEG